MFSIVLKDEGLKRIYYPVTTEALCINPPFRIIADRLSDFNGDDPSHLSKEMMIAQPLIKHIAGISSALVYRDRLVVTLRPGFTWNKVHDLVLADLKEGFDTKRVKVIDFKTWKKSVLKPKQKKNRRKK